MKPLLASPMFPIMGTSKLGSKTQHLISLCIDWIAVTGKFDDV
jgi:hypothetical protein